MADHYEDEMQREWEWWGCWLTLWYWIGVAYTRRWLR